MNERLENLLYESGLTAQGCWDELDGYAKQGIEQFAELIVRECAEVAQNFVTVENNKLVETIHISPWHLQDKIKEHFGVE